MRKFITTMLITCMLSLPTASIAMPPHSEGPRPTQPYRMMRPQPNYHDPHHYRYHYHYYHDCDAFYMGMSGFMLGIMIGNSTH